MTVLIFRSQISDVKATNFVDGMGSRLVGENEIIIDVAMIVNVVVLI